MGGGGRSSSGAGDFPSAKASRLGYGKLKQWVEAAGRVAKGRVAEAPAADYAVHGWHRRRLWN
jgi:hypothetical protein